MGETNPTGVDTADDPITLASRWPAPLAAAGFHRLVAAVPLLGAYCYLADGDAAAAAWRRLGHRVWQDHWVPGDVFLRLTGADMRADNMVLYPSAEDAVADLLAAWKEVRGDGR